MSPDVQTPRRPRRAGVGLAVLLSGLALAAPAAGAPLRDADYFAFADRIVAALPTRWDERGFYVSDGFHGAAARTNANLLLLHAVAALRGHTGPTRRDARARALVERMTSGRMFLLPSGTPVHGRSVCWGRRLDTSERDHVSLDSQIAEALAMAWDARTELRLDRAAAARIASAIDRCARHPAWRYPNGLTNQFNWNAQLYASAARVTGHRDLLRGDYRRFLGRFSAGITRPMPGMVAPNLGSGLGFHYSPAQPASARRNFDTPEYANIVLSTLQYYDRARDAGMAPLGTGAVHLLRGWVTRLVSGSWTHAGYLNWDTGYGRHRWNSGQYWAFAQQGLLAIATARRFWGRPEHGRWAKAIFDRGLELYARWAAREGGAIAPQLVFDVLSDHRDHDLYSTRIAANAARAVVLGLGSERSEDPPPLYAYDRETGRLAVTTPRYSTAIVPANRGAFAYGGVDLARLFGPGHRVAANIGGEPPSAFGVVVRDASGREYLSSQHARVRPGRLRVTRSPGARAAHPRPYARSAGPFRLLETRGTVVRGGVRIVSSYRFRPAHIEIRWRIRCHGACGGYTVEVRLPTWGAEAAIDVLGRDGRLVRLAGPGTADRATMPLAETGRIRLGRGRRGGYAVTPLRRARGAVLRTVATRPQKTNTHPGPTLAIRLPRSGSLTRAALAVRLVPHGGPAPRAGGRG